MTNISRRQGTSLLLCGLGAVIYAALSYFTLPRLEVAADVTVLLSLRWLAGFVAASGLLVAFLGWVMLPSVKTLK